MKHLLPLFILFAISTCCKAHGSSDTSKYSLRINWQFNFTSEWHLGKNFTVIQGIGPSYNTLGYGTSIEFNSGALDLYEQFTYLGGLRFYPTQNGHHKFAARGFRGSYFGLQYAVSFDQLIKPGVYRRHKSSQIFADEMSSVSFVMGYQTGIGRRFYVSANIGLGLNTFFADGIGVLAHLELGWRFWEPWFKD